MTSDAARFLADSPDRVRLLERLGTDPGSPRDVADELDQSRRSVQRNLAAFEDRGWVRKRNGEFHVTTKGDVVSNQHREYLDALETVEANDDLYRHLPRDAAPPPDVLADATVVAAEPDHPQAPVSHYVSVVEDVETERFRMIAPVLSRLFHDAHAQRVLDGVVTELVLDDGTVDSARERNPGEFAAVLAVPSFTLFRHPDPVTFGLTVADERALVLAYDDEGQVRACTDVTDPDAIAWAGDCFERYRSRSEAVSGLDALRS